MITRFNKLLDKAKKKHKLGRSSFKETATSSEISLSNGLLDEFFDGCKYLNVYRDLNETSFNEIAARQVQAIVGFGLHQQLTGSGKDLLLRAMGETAKELEFNLNEERLNLVLEEKIDLLNEDTPQDSIKKKPEDSIVSQLNRIKGHNYFFRNDPELPEGIQIKMSMVRSLIGSYIDQIILEMKDEKIGDQEYEAICEAVNDFIDEHDFNMELETEEKEQLSNIFYDIAFIIDKKNLIEGF